MNYIVYGMIALTAIPVVFGLLLGLLRGSRRAFIRLILVLLSIVLAYVLYGTATNALMEMNFTVNGESTTMQDYLVNVLMGVVSESTAQSLADYAVPLVQSIMQVVVFLLLFFGFWFITWLIIFPIFRVFIKKGKKPRRLLGGIWGVIQGAAVALVICIIFSGLIIQAGNIVAAADELQGIAGDSQTEQVEQYNDEMLIEDDADGNPDATDPDNESQEDDPSEGNPSEGDQSSGDDLFSILAQYTDMINDYAESGLGRFYTKIGTKQFNKITTVKLEDKTITLSGQVEAIHGLAKMAKELKGLQDYDFGSLFSGDGELDLDNLKNGIKDIFDKLGDINSQLSNEAKDTINGLIQSVAGEFLGEDFPLDLSEFNFTDIDFHTEGEVIYNMVGYVQKAMDEDLTLEDADDIIADITKSDLVFTIVNSQKDNIDFSDNIKGEQKQAVEEKLQALEENENISDEKLELLRDLFGLSKQAQ